MTDLLLLYIAALLTVWYARSEAARRSYERHDGDPNWFTDPMDWLHKLLR